MNGGENRLGPLTSLLVKSATTLRMLSSVMRSKPG